MPGPLPIALLRAQGLRSCARFALRATCAFAVLATAVFASGSQVRYRVTAVEAGWTNDAVDRMMSDIRQLIRTATTDSERAQHQRVLDSMQRDRVEVTSDKTYVGVIDILRSDSGPQVKLKWSKVNFMNSDKLLGNQEYVAFSGQDYLLNILISISEPTKSTVARANVSSRVESVTLFDKLLQFPAGDSLFLGVPVAGKSLKEHLDGGRARRVTLGERQFEVLAGAPQRLSGLPGKPGEPVWKIKVDGWWEDQDDMLLPRRIEAQLVGAENRSLRQLELELESDAKIRQEGATFIPNRLSVVDERTDPSKRYSVRDGKIPSLEELKMMPDIPATNAQASTEQQSNSVLVWALTIGVLALTVLLLRLHWVRHQRSKP